MTRKPIPRVPLRAPVKVRPASVRVRRSQVRDAISAELEDAIRGAIYRTWKHREDTLAEGVANVLTAEVETRVVGVLDEWLDWGEG